MSVTRRINMSGVALAALSLVSGPEGANAAQPFDYCSQSTKEAIFFVDVTNDMDGEADQESLLKGLSVVVGSLEAGQRIRVVTITRSPALAREIFKGCYPKCKEEGFLSACRPLNANIEKQNFISRMLGAVKPLLGRPGVSQSAIIMTLREWLPFHPNREVYIFSDLIENSDLVPWRRDGYWETLMRFLAAKDNHVYCGKLAGNVVHVFGFGRDHTKERHDLPPPLLVRASSAWEAFFKSCGAASTEIRNRLDAGR